MIDNKRTPQTRLRKIILNALKAAIKGLLLYILYYVGWQLIAPIAQMIPSLQQIVETFAITYIALVIIGQMAAGTIYQYLLSMAKTLFVISYLIFFLNNGIMTMTYQNVAVQVDARLFLVVAMMLGLVGFSKTLIQTINFAAKRAENT